MLGRALVFVPRSPEALNLTGVLYEMKGQPNAAYRAYRAALESDPDYTPALDNLRRYCERNKLDLRKKAIDSAAG